MLRFLNPFVMKKRLHGEEKNRFTAVCCFIWFICSLVSLLRTWLPRVCLFSIHLCPVLRRVRHILSPRQLSCYAPWKGRFKVLIPILAGSVEYFLLYSIFVYGKKKLPLHCCHHVPEGRVWRLAFCHGSCQFDLVCPCWNGSLGQS